MILSFSDEATYDIYHGNNTKKARSRLHPSLFPIAFRKLDMIDAASTIEDLRFPPSNHLESLKGSMKGMYSIRINHQYRIIFVWAGEGAKNVKVVDYH